jgi:hypothetical protein
MSKYAKFETSVSTPTELVFSEHSVSAVQALQFPASRYQCLHCKQLMRLIRSKTRAPHFQHCAPNPNCPDYDPHSRGVHQTLESQPDVEKVIKTNSEVEAEQPITDVEQPITDVEQPITDVEQPITDVDKTEEKTRLQAAFFEVNKNHRQALVTILKLIVNSQQSIPNISALFLQIPKDRDLQDGIRRPESFKASTVSLYLKAFEISKFIDRGTKQEPKPITLTADGQRFLELYDLGQIYLTTP